MGAKCWYDSANRIKPFLKLYLRIETQDLAGERIFSGNKTYVRKVFSKICRSFELVRLSVHASSVGDKIRYLLYVDGKRIWKRALHLSFTVPAKTFFNAVVLRVETTRVFIILTVMYYHTLRLYTVFVFDHNYYRYASRMSVDNVLRHFETNK